MKIQIKELIFPRGTSPPNYPRTGGRLSNFPRGWGVPFLAPLGHHCPQGLNISFLCHSFLDVGFLIVETRFFTFLSNRVFHLQQNLSEFKTFLWNGANLQLLVSKYLLRNIILYAWVVLKSRFSISWCKSPQMYIEGYPQRMRL